MAIQMPKRPHDTLLSGMGGLTLADFWSWAYSDVLSRGNRSVFAEFLVASALGVAASPRREWDMVDLRYDGKKIEVKASAHAQSWLSAGQPTSIRFGIALRRPWDAETDTLRERH